MTAMHLLEGLLQEGVTFYPETGDVITLLFPQGQRLYGLVDADCIWAIGLYGLVEEFHHYRELLMECTMQPLREAEPLAWRLLLAGYAGPGD